MIRLVAVAAVLGLVGLLGLMATPDVSRYVRRVVQTHWGGSPREFTPGQELTVGVRSKQSRDYYSHSFCESWEGEQDDSSADSPRSPKHKSPYSIEFPYSSELKTPGLKLACPDGAAGPLSKHEASALQQMIREGFDLHLHADGLPVTTWDLDNARSLGASTTVPLGFPLGAMLDGEPIIFNHLVFGVMVNNVSHRSGAEPGHEAAQAQGEEAFQGESWTVVGFQVMPCSVARGAYELYKPGRCSPRQDPINNPENPPPQFVREGEEIVYTYDVFWQESSTDWYSRWDGYLDNWSGIMSILKAPVTFSRARGHT